MDCSKKIHRTFPFLLLLVLTVFPGKAWAVQSHLAPEGLYVHQLAHVFYGFALCYLFWDIRQSEFQSTGWRFLQFFCILMVFWNGIALTGHTLSDYVNKSVLIQQAGYLGTTSHGLSNKLKLLFYFTSLDHLVTVPAFGFLFFSMKTLYRDHLNEEEV